MLLCPYPHKDKVSPSPLPNLTHQLRTERSKKRWKVELNEESEKLERKREREKKKSEKGERVGEEGQRREEQA